MKEIRTQDAVGMVLCHDITQIIRGVTKDAAFRKGHIVTEEDIPVLLSLGKDYLYVWENDENTLHENEAAEILCALCQGENIGRGEVKEGKISLFAECDGLLKVNSPGMRAVNRFGEMMIASRHGNFAVNKGDFEEIADCSNKSRYISASDLFDDYGTYEIKITFTENGTTTTLKDESVVVAEREPTTNPKLELYFDLYTVNLPADNNAHIYLPWEATGVLNIKFNNVDENITYSNGRASYFIPAWNLNHLGENEITATYTGDDFGTLTATETVIVVPTITAPFFVSDGENFTITMCTHEWVNGNFNVYDYNTGKKGKLLASNTIANRYSTVELSSNVIGLNKYYLEFDYPGGDYPIVQDVYVVKNSENISAEVPDAVELGSDATVKFTAPATPFGFVYISVDGGENEFFSLESGEVSKVISGLSAGCHKIAVQYNDGYFENGKLLGEVYSNTFNVNVGKITAIAAPDISTTYNNAKNLVVTLKDADGNVLNGKKVTIVLNGETYNRTSDSNGQVKLSVKLPAKTYNANFRFDGDSTYLKSSGSAKIVVKKATPKLAASSKTFKVKTKTKKVTVTLKNNKQWNQLFC